MSEKKAACLVFIGFPLSAFALYVLGCSLLTISIPNQVISALIGDGLFAFIYGLVYQRLYYQKCKQLFVKYRFSGFGLLVVVCVFMCVFLFSQLLGTWVNQHFPSDRIHSYFDLTGADLQFYVLMAVTVAPITEELLFRGFMYQFMRLRYGKVFCFFFSFVCFAAIHGTTEHIPVALFVTLFSCLLIEITENILYSMVFHMFYNLCGAVYVTQVPITDVGIFVGACITLLVLCVGLYFSDGVRDKLSPGGMTSLVDILDTKRKDMIKNDDD